MSADWTLKFSCGQDEHATSIDWFVEGSLYVTYLWDSLMKMGQLMHALYVGIDQHNYSLLLAEVLEIYKFILNQSMNVGVDKRQHPYLLLE